MQGELANNQHFSGDVDQGFIHFAIGIRKDAHPRNLIGEPIDVFSVVCFFNADEDHQATVDFSANDAIDGDGGFGYPLNDCAHGAANYNKPKDGCTPFTAWQKLVDNWW
jgi:hypothetical protein